jgi:predicted ATPase/class 3 adenylate cyclase
MWNESGSGTAVKDSQMSAFVLPPWQPAADRMEALTFLFTDIQGSTRLWEERPEAMRLALARHDALLRLSINRHGGTVFKTVGDAFYAVFATASDALEAAVAIQRSLAEAQPAVVHASLPLKVRVSIHTGEVEARDDDFFGPPLNRLARLLSAGHGGQILLSAAAQELVRGALPAEVSFSDLGEHRLRDLQRPERIYQVLHPALPCDFPPLRTLTVLSNNLPQQLSSFIGREGEMAEVRALLGGSRLVTLLGIGGTGKTRLAIQVGAELLEGHPDGVWLVELAALTDPELTSQAAAAALHVKEEPGKSVTASLIEYLQDKKLLLILDNCEHVIEAAALLADTVFRACTGVRILTTSREPLGIWGEQTYRVPSLQVPSAARSGPHFRAAELEQYAAAQLFTERAALAQPSFRVTDENAGTVAEICRRLDGIPLAIELAAARTRSMPLEQLLRRLDDRFRVLTGGSRTALPRQQTLRALIDWSYDLLSDPGRAVLRRASVFAGGWSLEAAEAVCAGDEVEDWEVLDLLTALVDRSLLIYEERKGEARYRMLETIREYGRERIREEGNECVQTHRRHREWFLALAERVGPEPMGPMQTLALDRLEADADNLRLALDGAIQNEPEAAVRIAAAIWKFWELRGYLTEGRRWLDQVLASKAGNIHARAHALSGAGTLAWMEGDFATATDLHEQSLLFYREAGNRRGTAFALNNLAVQYIGQGEVDRGIAVAEESLALFRKEGTVLDIALSLNNLGYFELFRQNYERAAPLIEEGLMMGRRAGDPQIVANTLHSLAQVRRSQGDYGAAAGHCRECLRIAAEMQYPRMVAEGLEGLAAVLCDTGDAEGGARLVGAAAAVRALIGLAWQPVEAQEYSPVLDSLRGQLGGDGFNKAYESGRALSIDEAIHCALGET